MQLQEMAAEYARSAQMITARMTELRLQERQEPDRDKRCRLRRRIRELYPLRQQCRELEQITRKYYDRSFFINGKYRV